MKEREIWYEKHPVSPERKAELLAKGYRIIDAKYKPASAEAEAENPADTNGDGVINGAEAKAALEAAGVKFHHRTGAAGLAALHAAFVQSGLSGEQWNALGEEEKAAHLGASKE